MDLDVFYFRRADRYIDAIRILKTDLKPQNQQKYFVWYYVKNKRGGLLFKRIYQYTFHHMSIYMQSMSFHESFIT